MWSSEEYDKKINEFMRRAGQLKEETPDETETELQKQFEEEVEKIEEMIARETPLKPCPFCGGKAKIMHMGYPHWIYCEDCGARVHGRKAGEVEGVRASAKIWNSRIDFLPPRELKGRNLTNEDCVDILSEIWNKLVKIPPISMEYCDAISRAKSALIRETKTNNDLQEKAIDVLRSTGWLQEHDKALTERPHGEWIPICVSVPEKDGRYIVSLPDRGGTIMCADYLGGKWYPDDYECTSNHVIAWRPLQPYRKEGGEK